MKTSFLIPLLCLIVHCSFGQTADLQKLFKENKFITAYGKVSSLTAGEKRGVSLTGIAWIKDKTFSKGVIEVDLRGKDVFQDSFLGIAFHGVDSITYDLIYFRPFNFRAEDPVRKIHAVQYVSHPEWTWKRLRDERNGMYEKAIAPPPVATDWFHARIEVGETEIKVFVNQATTPSLVVEKLNNRKEGMIGLWNDGQQGDFANLVIR